ncbi:reverse transcriptase domain-containing protein [Tanacetum coccineum]
MPNNVKTYDVTGDPEDHLKVFQASAQVERWAMPTWCHMFNSTLIGAVRVWFDKLPPESIDSYKDLKAAFLAYFMQQKKHVNNPVEIHNIKQKDGETIEEFMERFKVETGRMKGAPKCMKISGFMHGVNNLELTKRLNEHVPKTLEEMMTTTADFIRGEIAATSKKKVHTLWKPQDQSKRHNSERRSNFRNQPRDGRGLSKFTPQNRTPKEIFAAASEKFKPPPPMVTPVDKRSSNKFCEEDRDKLKNKKKEAPAKEKAVTIYMIQPWHKVTRQKVTLSFAQKNEITFPSLSANKGTEGPLVIEAEIGGHTVHRMYVDGGSSMEILYEHCFNQLRPEIKSQMVPATTSLTGFSGETIWPLGQLRLLVTIGDAEHFTKAWMNFMIVRSPSPYNGIIGRPGIREIQAVPSTAHGMLKFPVDGGVVTIRSTILMPNECATITATSKDSMKKIEGGQENLKVAIHHDFPDQEVALGGTLSIEGRTALCALLKRNLDIFAWQPTTDSRTQTQYLGWIPSGLTKKRGQAPERAKVIQTEACPQDCYPLPEIDWKVESLCGYPFKCFLDAYKGYHQIQMVEEDEEKTAFHTPHGVYCYTKMSFGLKNAGATYQRLVDKAIEKQVGRNLEVYVDDLVIKSHTEAELLRDIEEMFRIKSCPEKIEAVLQLLSPRTVKEVQSLNGKLAGLNRFLSKSTEKSLPLFKTLKKCVKNSDLRWTPEAEKAFRKLKQHISELPMLVAPRLKEELIMYLSASQGAVGAVLMTERDSIQMPVYFVSRALQGPELNYTPMEKLVLALVFPAKRLQSIMLGEHNITYRPRTSVKGQILVDFLVEKPEEASTDMSEKEIPQEPWTLFTDGSSCIDGSGAGLILTSPEGEEFIYALRFQLTVSNNEAEYEALLAELRIAAQMRGAQYTSPEKPQQKIGCTKQNCINQFRTFVKTGPGREYLKYGVLPDDKKEANKLRIKPRQYELMDGILYRRSFLRLWLRCVGPLQADYVIREIHEGSCSMHAGPRSMVAKAMRSGYYWPTMHRDARDMILKCKDCQGIDIAGPFPEGPGKVKFLIVAMDYFTKWIEAKAVATISGGQVKKFVWDNIVCRFGLPGEIVSDNGKQFSDNPFKDWCEKLNITQRFASVKHPQSNGLVERANKSLREGIKARLGEGNKN